VEDTRAVNKTLEGDDGTIAEWMIKCTFEEVVVLAPKGNSQLCKVAQQWRATKGNRGNLKKLQLLCLHDPIHGCKNATDAADYHQVILGSKKWKDVVESTRLWSPPMPVITQTDSATICVPHSIICCTLGDGCREHHITLMPWIDKPLYRVNRTKLTVEVPFESRWEVYFAIGEVVDDREATRDPPVDSLGSAKGDEWAVINVFLHEGQYTAIERRCIITRLWTRLKDFDALIGYTDILSNPTVLIASVASLGKLTPHKQLMEQCVMISRGKVALLSEAEAESEEGTRSMIDNWHAGLPI